MPGSRDSMLAELGEAKARAARLEVELGLRDTCVPPARVETADRNSIYELISDYGSDFISVHAANGDYIYAGTSCERLFGWEPEDLLGRSAYEFFHPDDLARIATDHAGHEASEEQRVRYRLKCKDGGFLWVETRSRSRKEDSGVEQIVAITQEVDTEERARRNHETATSLLEQSERNTLVGGLIGTFHHELNNPLTAAFMTLDLLAEEVADEQVLEDVRENLVRIRDVIQELSSLAVVSFESLAGPVDLMRLLSQIEHALSERRGCVVELQAEDLSVLGSEGQVWQCLQNVVFSHLHGERVPGEFKLEISCIAKGEFALVEIASPCRQPPEFVRAELSSLLRGGSPLRDVPMRLAMQIAKQLGGDVANKRRSDDSLVTSLQLPLAPPAERT